MAVCSSCGQKLPILRAGALCKKCEGKKWVSMAHAALHMAEDFAVHPLRAASDLIVQTKEQIEIGDLFVLEEGLVFIPYARKVKLSPALQLTGWVLAGLAGAVEAGKIDKEVQVELFLAKRARQEAFGTAIESRLSKTGISQVVPIVPRSAVTTIEPDQAEGCLKVVFTPESSPQGGAAPMTMPLEVKDVAEFSAYLSDWRQGRRVESKDIQGADLDLPPVPNVIKSLARREPGEDLPTNSVKPYPASSTSTT